MVSLLVMHGMDLRVRAANSLTRTRVTGSALDHVAHTVAKHTMHDGDQFHTQLQGDPTSLLTVTARKASYVMKSGIKGAVTGT